MTKQARLFTTGGSQTVRLPAEFRFDDVEAVYVRRNSIGEAVLSTRSPFTYGAFMVVRDAIGPLEADFLSPEERGQRSEARDPFAGGFSEDA